MHSYSFFKKYLGVPLFTLILGIGLGHLLDITVLQSSDRYSEIRSNSSAYHFINPLLQCDTNEANISSYTRNQPLRSTIESVINKQKELGNVSFVSVYYRDLNNGPWIGVNENERFYPASLMKVPLMFYFLKKSESNPSILQAKVNGKDIPQVISFDQHFPPLSSIDPKKTYTVEELIESMIKNSDNKAANNLVSIMPDDGLMNILKDLYIELPQNSLDDYMKVTDYATLFRVLFNASYLNKANSEKALSLLSQTTFNDGLKKYLPSSVVVAHKFGEHELENSNENQIHDCGIIYYPGKPYLLCVMTRGKNFDNMLNTIGLLSQSVYNSVSGTK